MSFDENGFLGNEILEIRKKRMEELSEVYKLGYEINNYINIMKFKIEANESDLKEITVVSMLIKIIHTYNSIILLASYGLETDAKSLARVIIESAIKFIVIIKNDNYYRNSFLLEELRTTKNFIETIEKNEDLNDEIKDFARGYNKTDLQKKLSRYKPYKMNQLAEEADMLDIYFFMYKLYCSNVHTDISNIDDFIIIDDNKIKWIDSCPKYNSDKAILLLCSDVILRVFERLSDYKKLGLEADIKSYKDRVYSYMDKY